MKEFNLRNYSSDTDRDEMLTFLTKQIIQDYTYADLGNLMDQMSYTFQRDSEGNHFTGEMDVNEDNLSYEEKEGKLQQAKRGGGKETSLRAIAALNE